MVLNLSFLFLGVLCTSGIRIVFASFGDEGLEAHNKYRRIHDAPAMRLNDDMSQQATAYAGRLARMGKLKHSSSRERPGQGENLAMSCGYGGLSGQRATEMWYKEVCKFNFDNPGWGYGTGHFTQVVWKKSVELGIGKAVSGRCTYVVGRYKPAGNVLNNFRENVAKGSFDWRSYCRGGGGGGWRPGGWRPVGRGEVAGGL